MHWKKKYFLLYRAFKNKIKFIDLFKRRELGELYTVFWWDYNSTSRKIIKKRIEYFYSVYIYYFSFEFYNFLIFFLLFFLLFFNIFYFGFFFNSIFCIYLYFLLYHILNSLFYLFIFLINLIIQFFEFFYFFFRFFYFFFRLPFFIYLFYYLYFVKDIIFNTYIYLIFNSMYIKFTFVKFLKRNFFKFIILVLLLLFFFFFLKFYTILLYIKWYYYYNYIFFFIFFIFFVFFRVEIENILKPIDINWDFIFNKRYNNKQIIKKIYILTKEDRYNIYRQEKIEFIKKILFFLFFFFKTKTYKKLKKFLKNFNLFLKFFFKLCFFKKNNFREFIIFFTIWTWTPNYIDNWDVKSWHQTYTYKKTKYKLSFYDLKGFLFYIFIDISAYSLVIYRYIHFLYWEAFFLQVQTWHAPIYGPIEKTIIYWYYWLLYILWKDPVTYRNRYKKKVKNFIFYFLYLDIFEFFFNFKNLYIYLKEKSFLLNFLFFFYIFLVKLKSFILKFLLYFLNFFKKYYLKFLFIFFYFIYIFLLKLINVYNIMYVSMYYFFYLIIQVFFFKSFSFNLIYKKYNDIYFFRKKDLKYYTLLLRYIILLNKKNKIKLLKNFSLYKNYKLLLLQLLQKYIKNYITISSINKLPFFKRFMIDMSIYFKIDTKAVNSYKKILYKFKNFKLEFLIYKKYNFLFYNNFINKKKKKVLYKLINFVKKVK